MHLSPYYSTKNGVLYHGDCLEIMPHLEPVDLVLKNALTGSTKTGTISHEEKQERSLQDGSGKGVVGATASRDRMAVPRSEVVNEADSGLFQSIPDRNEQDNP